MHAQRIIQDFLATQCPAIHAKRRHSLALMVDAAGRGGIGMMSMSKAMSGQVALRHRIKRCDRLLSNEHLGEERIALYRALAQRVLGQQCRVGIVVDWSTLLADSSQHVLRAAVMAQGRALVIYEEVHPEHLYGAPQVHRKFMATLRSVLPHHCQPVIITDAGFRATWFHLLKQLGFAWIGRIRNRDMVKRLDDDSPWHGCKELYASTRGRARELGQFFYTRSNPVSCRLVMIKRAAKGRQHKTLLGKRTRSAHSNKQRAGQREPWLLAVAPRLAALSSDAIVALYAGRMQIEQTFRDLKSAQWGMGLSHSQTRQPQRLAILLLIAALLGLALWLIGLIALGTGYKIQYGSRKKAISTLSILSLARHWISDRRPAMPSRRQLVAASNELTSRLMTYEI